MTGKRKDPSRTIGSEVPGNEATAAEMVGRNVEEPCRVCGEETAVGSVFYSDRREIEASDGTRVYLCSECQALAHRARKGRPLSAEDLRTIADNGMMIGVGFLGGGGGF